MRLFSTHYRPPGEFHLQPPPEAPQQTASSPQAAYLHHRDLRRTHSLNGATTHWPGTHSLEPVPGFSSAHLPLPCTEVSPGSPTAESAALPTFLGRLREDSLVAPSVNVPVMFWHEDYTQDASSSSTPAPGTQSLIALRPRAPTVQPLGGFQTESYSSCYTLLATSRLSALLALRSRVSQLCIESPSQLCAYRPAPARVAK